MKLNLRRLDLNLLLVFDALMQEQNLSRAAVRLNLSQPAVSNALARLRSQLDEPLFIRTARGMQPTPRAHVLHGSVRQALRLLQEGLDPGSEFDPAASDQTFTLSMNDYAQARLLPALSRRLQSAAPKVRLAVRSDAADSLPAWLTTGMLDLAVDYLYFDDPDLCYQPLLEEQLVVIGRIDHPAFEPQLGLKAYEQSQHVAIPDRGGRGSPLEIVLGSAKVQRHVQLFVPHYLSIPLIVAQSDLLGTVPRRLAEHFCALMPIRIAELPLVAPPVQVSLIWHRQQERGPGHRWLREEIIALAARFVQQPELSGR
ncbi:transcriptional regulator, LysR family [Pseudomonas sp. NFIX51]|uniref:LysR family transcriptional regulator BsrA n=1 Tax=unclassified Pseudomonas TaxID=196821 RepID=UPI0008D3569E|nr:MULTISPECIES: LysR family transcriptional regulator [unclassified Pseudomonas]SEM20415.1 DNA-binding transcriptional regulator, LysR family [Pseudomonas sp. NFACC41-3]SMH61527.1 transcriptional regulator, LysR family [Pseudomonas sp. NFIX51]